MGKFQWAEGITDEEIMKDGVVLTVLGNTTSAKLQNQIEFISEVIEVKLDFRVTAGRYFVMCKRNDVDLVYKKLHQLEEAVESLQSIHEGILSGG